MKTELYGLMTGPLAWKNALYAYLNSTGFVQQPLGVCALLWHHPVTRELDGILLRQVYDVLGGGGGEHPDFQHKLSQSRKRFKFGKWRELVEQADFNGRCLRQVSRQVIDVNMVEHVKQIEVIEIHQRHPVDGSTITQRMGIGWCSELVLSGSSSTRSR